MNRQGLRPGSGRLRIPRPASSLASGRESQFPAPGRPSSGEATWRKKGCREPPLQPRRGPRLSLAGTSFDRLPCFSQHPDGEYTRAKDLPEGNPLRNNGHSREACPREGGERESTSQAIRNKALTEWIPAFAGMTVLGRVRVSQMTRVPGLHLDSPLRLCRSRRLAKNPCGQYGAGHARNNFAEYQWRPRNFCCHGPASWMVYLGIFPDRPER